MPASRCHQSLGRIGRDQRLAHCHIMALHSQCVQVEDGVEEGDVLGWLRCVGLFPSTNSVFRNHSLGSMMAECFLVGTELSPL